MATPEPVPPAGRRRGFDRVETWVFDLDNTLYPHHLNLWQQVDVRIRDYIAKFLDVTHSTKRSACRRTITAATARPCAA